MMEHRAFLFDYQQFANELLPILEDALAATDCSALIAFIQQHFNVLTDPYEGSPLARDWEEYVEMPDAHQYGDFALTRYYDPANDIGLGSSWEPVQDLIATDPDITTSPILGSVIGPSDRPFDPGKMGAYFQSEAQVEVSFEYVLRLSRQISIAKVNEAVELLKRASRSRKGLYVTF